MFGKMGQLMSLGMEAKKRVDQLKKEDENHNGINDFQDVLNAGKKIEDGLNSRDALKIGQGMLELYAVAGDDVVEFGAKLGLKLPSIS